MLQLENVHTYYGESHILHGVSLHVERAELVCLLGRNGAGKTTIIRSIMGYNQPREGSVLFEGHELLAEPTHRRARLGVGLVPQGRRIFADLTVKENLAFAANRTRGSWDVAKAFSVFPRLKDRQTNRGDQLSGGEQQMLAIARALLMNPKLILMDEPSEGLAPLIVREVGQLIGDVQREEGISVLLVEQNLALGLSVSNRCYVLNKGQIVYESTPAELDRNAHVKQRFLGV
jgi:branched-chain amino acid transport system ATP-binding protein